MAQIMTVDVEGTGGTPRHVALLVGAGTGLVVAAFLYRSMHGGFVLRAWNASQFWINYAPGFTRRGLLGQLLAWASEGSPSGADVAAAGVLLSLAGVASWLLMAWLATGLVESVAAKTTVALLLASSPFTLAEVAEDIGRYDAIAVVVAAVLAWSARRGGRWVTTAMAVIGLLVAAGSAEFEAAFLAPLALVALWRSRVPWVVAVAAVTPGCVLAVASGLARPGVEQMLMYARNAHTARPDIPADGSQSAILALRQTFAGSLVNFSEMHWWTFPGLTVAFGGVVAVTVWLLWRLLGRPCPRLVWALTGLYSVEAVALCVAGIDYRRWWAMAFLAAAATIVVLARTGKTGAPPRTGVVVTVLVVSVLAAGALPRSSGEVDAGARDTLVQVR